MLLRAPAPAARPPCRARGPCAVRASAAVAFVAPAPVSAFTLKDGRKVEEYATTADASAAVAAAFLKAYNEVVPKKGRICIAIPSGSVVKALGSLRTTQGIDWSKVHVWFTNERDGGKTFSGDKDDFLIPCGVPLSNAHPAHIERPDKVGAHGLPDADYAAAAYEKEMMATTIIQKHPLFLGKPSFDLILLGTGDDGHCASLNPQTEQINDTSGRSVLPIQPVQVGGGLPAEQAASSDKPAGVTFSMGLINNAQRVVVSAGEKKRATMVLRALTRSMPGEVCPASLVQCIGTTTWITDSDSMAAYKAAAH